MKPNVKILNLGPHTETVLAIQGPDPVTVTGGSGVGKSLIIDAVCMALLGLGIDGAAFDIDLIAEGADRAEVSLELNGHRMRVGVTRAGTWSRQIIAAEPVRIPSRAEWLTAIGIDEPDLVRFVLTPMSAEPLLADQCGRPLRDLLVKAAGKDGEIETVVGALMKKAGHALDAKDPLEEAAAEKKLAAANRTEAVSAGMKESAAGRRAAWTAPAAGPDDAAITGAHATVEAAEEWSAYDRAVAATSATTARADQFRATIAKPLPDAIDTTEADRILAAVKAWQAHADAVRTWEMRHAAEATARAANERRTTALAALGERPAVPADPGTRERIARGETVTGGLRTSVARLQAEADHAERHLVQVKNGGSTCPTCGEKPSAAKTAEIEATAQTEATTKRAAATAEAEKLKRSEATLAELKKALDAYDTAKAKADAYDRELARIGPVVTVPAVEPRPTAPDVAFTPDEERTANDTRERAQRVQWERQTIERERAAAQAELASLPTSAIPVEPTMARPTAAEVTAATAVLAESKVAVSRAADAKAERGRLDADVERTTKQHAADAAEAARCQALLDAIRRAPGVQLERLRARFGDLGPVRFRVPPKETKRSAEIELLVDTVDAKGHTKTVRWAKASDGWRIVADLYLRAAVRRLAGLDWLPLFVDRPALWSGDWPAIPGVVFLWTEAGPLRVEREAVAA